MKRFLVAALCISAAAGIATYYYLSAGRIGNWTYSRDVDKMNDSVSYTARTLAYAQHPDLIVILCTPQTHRFTASYFTSSFLGEGTRLFRYRLDQHLAEDMHLPYRKTSADFLPEPNSALLLIQMGLGAETMVVQARTFEDDILERTINVHGAKTVVNRLIEDCRLPIPSF